MPDRDYWFSVRAEVLARDTTNALYIRYWMDAEEYQRMLDTLSALLARIEALENPAP